MKFKDRPVGVIVINEPNEEPLPEIRVDGILLTLDGRPETKKVPLRGGIQLQAPPQGMMGGMGGVGVGVGVMTPASDAQAKSRANPLIWLGGGPMQCAQNPNGDKKVWLMSADNSPYCRPYRRSHHVSRRHPPGVQVGKTKRDLLTKSGILTKSGDNSVGQSGRELGSATGG